MRDRIAGIQYLRAVACLMVLVAHTVYDTGVHDNLDTARFVALDLGTKGVVLFFVISGYVISGLISDRPARFVHNRVARIYPTFWMAVALSVILQGFFTRNATTLDLHTVFLISTPKINNTVLVPFWTLTFEVAFYVVCAAFTFTQRKNLFWIALGVWSTVIAFASWTHVFTGPLGTPPVSQILLSPIDLAFILGALVRLVVDDFATVPKWVCAVAIWPALVTAVIGTPEFSTARLGLECALVLACVLRMPRIRFLEPLHRIGDWSYGIYLVHVIFIVVFMDVVAGHLGFVPACLVLGLIALAGGIAFGELDVRLYRQLRAKPNKRTSPEPSVGESARVVTSDLPTPTHS